MPRKPTRLRAKTGFAVPQKGTSRLVVVKGGQEVDADDPIVKGREDQFVPVDDRPVVEQATQAPGEQRIVKKPQHVCDVEVDGEPCGFTAKSAAGLGSHKASHDSEDD